MPQTMRPDVEAMFKHDRQVVGVGVTARSFSALAMARLFNTTPASKGSRPASVHKRLIAWASHPISAGR